MIRDYLVHTTVFCSILFLIYLGLCYSIQPQHRYVAQCVGSTFGPASFLLLQQGVACILSLASFDWNLQEGIQYDDVM